MNPNASIIEEDSRFWISDGHGDAAGPFETRSQAVDETAYRDASESGA
jgi:hypothetical protein